MQGVKENFASLVFVEGLRLFKMEGLKFYYYAPLLILLSKKKKVTFSLYIYIFNIYILGFCATRKKTFLKSKKNLRLGVAGFAKQ